MIEHILLDMDGVISNFVKGANIAHNKDINYEPSEWDFFKSDWGLETQEFWDGVDADEDFWTNLEEYPWTDEIILLVKQCPFDILTCPSRNPHCYSGKRKWIQNKFGYEFDQAIFAKTKFLFAKPEHLLIDDGDHNIDEFVNHGGNAILFPQPWNSNRDQVHRRMDYVRDEFDKLGLLTGALFSS